MYDTCAGEAIADLSKSCAVALSCLSCAAPPACAGDAGVDAGNGSFAVGFEGSGGSSPFEATLEMGELRTFVFSRYSVLKRNTAERTFE